MLDSPDNLTGSHEPLDGRLDRSAGAYSALCTEGAVAESPSLEPKRSLEDFHGLGSNRQFEDAVARQLAVELTGSGSIDKRAAIFEAHNIHGIDPAIAPHHSLLEALTLEDWDTVRAAQQPLLTLYAASNYHIQDQRTTFRPAGRQTPVHENPRLGYAGLENRAVIKSLPLIHGMSADAFTVLVQSGTMHSNKRRYEESGLDPESFKEAGVGATNYVDRTYGLDQMVFFDYAHPSAIHRSEQPEITLVVDPSIISQPGVFMTGQDLFDTRGKGSVNSIATYMNGLTTPEYFEETALLRIYNTQIETGESNGNGYAIHNTMSRFLYGQDGDFDQDGRPLFSTYEWKVPDPPGVTVEAIKRVIVRDEAKFKEFQETLGDRFEFVYEPKLRAGGGRMETEGDPRSAPIDPGNYEVLQIPGAFEQKMEELIEADYQARVQALGKLEDDDKEQAIVVFGTTGPEALAGQNVRTRIDAKTNPYRYPDQMVATYASMDALRADVRAGAGMSFGYSAGDQPLWFADAFTNQPGLKTASQMCVVAMVERSKLDPSITRIVESRSFNLQEISQAAQ